MNMKCERMHLSIPRLFISFLACHAAICINTDAHACMTNVLIRIGAWQVHSPVPPFKERVAVEAAVASKLSRLFPCCPARITHKHFETYIRT